MSAKPVQECFCQLSPREILTFQQCPTPSQCGLLYPAQPPAVFICFCLYICLLALDAAHRWDRILGSLFCLSFCIVFLFAVFLLFLTRCCRRNPFARPVSYPSYSPGLSKDQIVQSGWRKGWRYRADSANQELKVILSCNVASEPSLLRYV